MNKEESEYLKQLLGEHAVVVDSRDDKDFKHDRIVMQNKELLKKLLGKYAVIADSIAKDDKNDRIVMQNKDELLKGELYAMIYDFGIYTLRIADRIFHDSRILTGFYIPGGEKPEPASEEEIKAQTFQTLLFGVQPTDYSYRRATEVSVRFKKGGEGFRTLCYCTEARNNHWWESLGFVGTVKKHRYSRDKSSVLYIHKHFFGEWSLNQCNYWYAVYPDGRIEHWQV